MAHTEVGSKKKEYILSGILWKVKGSWPRIDESNHRVLVSNIQANRHFKGQKVDENALLEVAMDFFLMCTLQEPFTRLEPERE